MKEVKFKKFSAKATAPKRATLSSAGYGPFSPEKVTIDSLRAAIVSTDVSMQFDHKLVGKINSRSSFSARPIEVGAWVVDSDYRGIIYVVLHNLPFEKVTSHVGDNIAQIVFGKFTYNFNRGFWFSWSNRKE